MVRIDDIPYFVDTETNTITKKKRLVIDIALVRSRLFLANEEETRAIKNIPPAAHLDRHLSHL